MRVSVVVFPGTNCDHDVEYLYGSKLSAKVEKIWHRDTDLKSPDVVVVPGGFSYGDYLRTGALAKISPVMTEIKKFAEKGGSVIGICNGFQILCEAQLLPGVLLQNVGMKFISQFVHVKVENTNTPFTNRMEKGSIITCPIAHFEGNYFADSDTLKSLEDNGQVVFRYCDINGRVDANDRSSNVNGSIDAIAGITNQKGNVVGLMPHPERIPEGLVDNDIGKNGMELFAL